jgi:hypothetical protein
MADDDELMFEVTAAKAPPGHIAVKTRVLNPDGGVIKGDAPHVTFWLYKILRCLNIPEHVAALLLEWNARQDVMMLHGAPAHGLDLRLRHPRWYGENRGSDATIVSGQRASLLFDTDKIKAPEGSRLGLAEYIEEQARFVREEVLPRPFRDVTLIVRASASTGFDPLSISLHIYVLLNQLIPLATLYRYVRGLWSSGVSIDPSVMLPGQPVYSARPVLRGLVDPVPPSSRVFVLPGFMPCARDVDWLEFEPQLAVREATEQRMRAAGAQYGILAEGLGGMPGMFFGPISSAMGRGLAEGIPIDELAGAMHAVISNHPDCDADRRHRYSEARLRQDLKRLAARDARCVAQIDEIRRRLVVPKAATKEGGANG